jgi:murein DD-endopeptidase MepM/ murein hydrolase activator NlpD
MTLTSDAFKRSSISINNISKSLGTTRKSLSTVNTSVNNISKIIANNTRSKRILNEKSSLLISRREEASRRREIEDQSESKNVSTNIKKGYSFANKGEGSPLSRLIGFLGFTTAGWIIENLPTWTFMGKEFISRIQTFGTSMYSMIGNMRYTIDLFGDTLGGALNALVRLDFKEFSSEGVVTKTFDEFNNSLQDLGDKLTDTFKLFTTPLSQSLTTGEQAPGLGDMRPDSLYETPESTPSRPVTGIHRQALDIIAGPESGGNYNAMNQGGDGMYGIYGSGSSDSPNLLGKKLTDMTVAEVMERQRKNKSYNGPNKVGIFAAGRYQFIPSTLKSIVDAGIIKVTDKFDAATQDKAALYLIKKNGIRDWAWDAESLARFTPQDQGIVERARTTPITTSLTQTQPTTPRVTNLNVPKVTIGDRAGYSSSRGRNHNGRDLPMPSGTPVSVITDAEITDVGYESGGYGYFVAYLDSNGIEHFYAHLKELPKVKIGQRLTSGTVIGYVGSTGRSTGPHLHWEISPKLGEVGRPRRNIIDPLEYGFPSSAPFTGTRQPSTQAQISPPPRQQITEEIKPERKGPQVVVIDDTPPPLPQEPPIIQTTTPLSSNVPSSAPLNNFIKNKLLLDLMYV